MPLCPYDLMVTGAMGIPSAASTLIGGEEEEKELLNGSKQSSVSAEEECDCASWIEEREDTFRI